jgi:predicted amidohydrolase
MGVVRVSAAQLSLQVGDVEANRSAASGAIASAAERGVQVLVLPELTQSGYVFRSPEEARTMAEPVEGPTVSGWCQASADLGLVLVAGFCELGQEHRQDGGRDGQVYNSAVLIDRGEVLAVYRKAHLWDEEAAFFVPGSSAPPVVSTSIGAVGMMICYDLEFPEWTRMVGVAGADILAAPTNWPLATGIPDGERPAEVVKVQAAAAVNRMFVVAADRTGRERGVDWVGGSVIVDPDGYPLSGPLLQDGPGTVTADLDLERARDKRINQNNHVFDDRRLELYR